MASRLLFKYVIMTAAFLLTSLLAFAQPKALGVSFSYTGVAISYDHKVNESSYLDIELKSENGEYYAGRSEHPGLSTAVAWLFVFKEWKSSYGNTIELYAGPCVTMGYCADYKTSEGIMYGLKGKIGGRCAFKRNVVVSVSLSPTIGYHLLDLGDTVQMKYYRSGFQYALIPEFAIKYMF